MLGHSMLGGWGDGPKRISGVSCVRSSAGQLQVSTPQGPMNVTVPPGVVPGQSFAFQLPPVVATPVSAMLALLLDLTLTRIRALTPLSSSPPLSPSPLRPPLAIPPA